jgi:hypothetical protein
LETLKPAICPNCELRLSPKLRLLVRFSAARREVPVKHACCGVCVCVCVRVCVWWRRGKRTFGEEERQGRRAQGAVGMACEGRQWSVGIEPL